MLFVLADVASGARSTLSYQQNHCVMGRMCGISGIIQRREGPVDRGAIDRMVAAQKHRGPDGEGVFEGPGFLFGHNRLAILDLSHGGAQPMKLEVESGEQLVLTYNGEIYNYLELRDELIGRGHRFHSQTDTEVILHAYKEWGVDCLTRFNGMFAFVLYDSGKKRLFGARDRFGVKPLHLCLTPETLMFASEIKALLAVAPATGVDRQTVVDYLYAGHLHHSGRTFFAGIEELKAGHRFIYDLRAHELKIEPWYVLRDHIQDLTLNATDAAAELRKQLGDSVRLRLRSDVRVGTCLSGGVDSSSIASIAANSYPPGTFIGITAESLDPENNETEFARAVAENSKLEWHTVRPEDFRAQLIDVIKTQDEPFAGLSVFMQDAVMREARRLNVPVLLDGQGGDEVFLGYPKYLQAKLLPPPRLFAKKVASAMGWMESREFESELKASMPRELEVAKDHLLKYRRALSEPRAAQILDITETNLPQLLRYEDRNSMRHSIETRLPFLDYRVVEFGLGLSFDLKVKGNVQKAVLRDAMRDVVPAPILGRHDKIGFAAPDRTWQPHFEALWRDHVADSKLLKELVPTVVTKSPSEFSASAKWKLINLAIWSETYFI
jgi:asparagine synthase (glutamine-hydrolysing)